MEKMRALPRVSRAYDRRAAGARASYDAGLSTRARTDSVEAGLIGELRGARPAAVGPSRRRRAVMRNVVSDRSGAAAGKLCRGASPKGWNWNPAPKAFTGLPASGLPYR